jgi:hypothetical protein
VIVADVNNNGRIDSNDASQLAQFLINNASVPAIPPIPSPAPTITFGGPDPTLSLPTDQTATDGVVVVPVLLDDPHPAGSSGMTEASLALTFDPKVFSVSAADVRLGTIPTSGSGWKLSTSIDSTTGQLGIRLYSATPIATSANGSLVEITFQVLPGTTASATAVQLVGSVQMGGQEVRTEVDDNQGAYTLSPAPTNAAPVSGVVVLTPEHGTSGAIVSAGSEEGMPRPTDETVVVAPPANQGTENGTGVSQEESSEVAVMDAATPIGSVEGNPLPRAAQLSVPLASAPSDSSSSPMFQVLASPSLEQVLPGGDFWDRLAAEPSSNSAAPAEWSAATSLREPSADSAEGVGSASALQRDAASRDAALPAAAPGFAGQNRITSSALDELFAAWSDRIERRR